MYYKDMEVWKESITLVLAVYKITNDFPADEKYGIVPQMRRCAVSIPSNISEGVVKTSNKDSVRFIEIAMGSLAELDTQLVISEKLGYISSMEIIKPQIDKVFALLRGVKKYLENGDINS